MNIVRVSFLVILLTGFAALFSQESINSDVNPIESAESQMSTIIKTHFGSDLQLMRTSHGRFREAKDLIAYISHVGDVSLPADTNLVDSLPLIDKAKSTALKKIFGCEGDPSEQEADELSERCEVIEILVGVWLNSYLRKTVTAWAEKKRLLNLVKDDLARGNDIQAQQANRDEIRALHAEVRNFSESLESSIQSHKALVLDAVNDDEIQEELELERNAYNGDIQQILAAILNDE